MGIENIICRLSVSSIDVLEATIPGTLQPRLNVMGNAALGLNPKSSKVLDIDILILAYRPLSSINEKSM